MRGIFRLSVLWPSLILGLMAAAIIRAMFAVQEGDYSQATFYLLTALVLSHGYRVPKGADR